MLVTTTDRHYELELADTANVDEHVNELIRKEQWVVAKYGGRVVRLQMRHVERIEVHEGEGGPRIRGLN